MKLFPFNSAKDLICRGYKQDEILKATNVDTGYHHNKFKKELTGIDRTLYKYEHIKQRFTESDINNHLQQYSDGCTKRMLLSNLLIHDYDKFNLRKCFTHLGYKPQFELADKNNKLNYLHQGTLSKFGVDNVFKLDEFQDKAADTRETKYGGRYTLSRDSKLEHKARQKINQTIQSNETKRKRENTMLKRYGVKYPIQSLNIKQKMIQTNIERYGVEHPSQSDEVKQKISASNMKHRNVSSSLLDPNVRAKIDQTNLKRYGTKYPSQTVEIKHKIIQTNFKRYGVPYVSQNPEVRAKARQTNIERYGVEHPSQSDEVKQKVISTNLEQFGVPYAIQSTQVKEKARLTNLKRYGVEHKSQTPEARKRQSDYMKRNSDKIVATKKKNGTLNISKPEDDLHRLLKQRFPDVISQYKSNDYPFHCDFYIPSKQLYIELNASWTHNTHWFNDTNQDDIKQANEWSHSTPYYKQAHKTWTQYDVTKRQTAQENNLNYLVFWQSDLSDVRLWLAMNCPNAHDWKREYSWLPLHRIPTTTTPNITPLKSGSKTITKIARQFMYPVIYERELNLWNNNAITRKGHIQPFIYANRLKYIDKAPDRLTDLELLRGINISGQIRAYTAFDNTLMKQVIEKYQPKSIYDPCAGWGERLLTAAAYDIPYFGQDVNKKLKGPYAELINAYGLIHQNITIVDSSRQSQPADMLITCPPYGSTEVYSNYGAETLPHEQFLKWWNDVISIADVNMIAFQINQRYKKELSDIIVQNGYTLVEELNLRKQKSHLNKTKREYESMLVFRKQKV